MALQISILGYQFMLEGPLNTNQPTNQPTNQSLKAYRQLFL